MPYDHRCPDAGSMLCFDTNLLTDSFSHRQNFCKTIQVLLIREEQYVNTGELDVVRKLDQA